MSPGYGFCPDGMLTVSSLWHCGIVGVHHGWEPGSDTLGWCLSKAAIMKGSHAENRV